MTDYTGGQLQEQIIALARLKGWTVAHFRPALTQNGWRTPVSADGQGFPDLILVRPPRILVFECKGRYEKLTHEQAKWLTLFSGCGASGMVVRSDDWPDVEILLE